LSILRSRASSLRSRYGGVGTTKDEMLDTRFNPIANDEYRPPPRLASEDAGAEESGIENRFKLCVG